MASFFNLFLGFFVAQTAADIAEEYQSGTGIGYKSKTGTQKPASSVEGNEYQNTLNNFEVWQRANGLLDADGHIDHEAHERFMGR